VAFYELFAPLN